MRITHERRISRRSATTSRRRKRAAVSRPPNPSPGLYKQTHTSGRGSTLRYAPTGRKIHIHTRRQAAGGKYTPTRRQAVQWSPAGRHVPRCRRHARQTSSSHGAPARSTPRRRQPVFQRHLPGETAIHLSHHAIYSPGRMKTCASTGRQMYACTRRQPEHSVHGGRTCRRRVIVAPGRLRSQHTSTRCQEACVRTPARPRVHRPAASPSAVLAPSSARRGKRCRRPPLSWVRIQSNLFRISALSILHCSMSTYDGGAGRKDDAYGSGR